MQKLEYGTVEVFRVLFGTVRCGLGREKSSRVLLYLLFKMYYFGR